MARGQLGTVGSGNHYVDLFEDEEGFVWIGVHFGSRGLGHKTRDRAISRLARRQGRHGRRRRPWSHQDSELGAQLHRRRWSSAGRYAYAGREWVCERVRQIIGGAVTDSVHNHHNYAWRETHGERELWVVRKGATPAFPGQRGFVGGSMGDDAVILEGVESEASADASTRRCTAPAALRARTRGKERDRRMPAPASRREEMDAWLRSRGVMLRGADLDESPLAYRRLPDVLAHHAGTVRVLHTLRPFAVAMAGAGEFDPFKD